MIENIVFLELVGLDVIPKLKPKHLFPLLLIIFIFELNQLSTYSRVKKE
jgi:hypothetical protein